MTSPSPAPSLRLFLALWPPASVAAELQRQADAWTWPGGARRTRPERLHITLHFIGQVATARIPSLQDALRVPWGGCELLLDRAEVWPGGIAVLEAGTVPEALAALHADLGRRLHEQSLAVEARRYRPHVTFARKATGSRPATLLPPVVWRAPPEYALVQSLPGGRGYLPLQWFR